MKRSTTNNTLAWKSLPQAMRKSALFMLFSFLVISSFANNSYSQNVKLSLHMATGKANLKDAISEIKNQTDFDFLYNKEIESLYSNSGPVDVSNGTIEEVLNQVFRNSDIQYQVVNKTIALTAKKSSETESNRTQQDNSPVVKGTISDAKGEPLVGVSIVVKGTTTGTVTDLDGQFSIQAKEGATLEITYIGYTNTTYSVGPQSSKGIKIALSEDVQMMEEVVVVGYGVQKKVNVIGSISQVSGEKLENRTVPLLSNAMAGQMTGVTVIQRSGQPGNSPGDIKIRGVGTFSQAENAADALVLIDGVPGSINDVKPEDVESMSVLKDAATAAIYGSRAANGVILISTKTGKDGKVRVSYNGYVGTTHPTAFPDLVNSWEYATMYNEATKSQTFSQEAIQKYKDGSDPDNYPNSNFLKSTFSRDGIQTGHDLSITGGNNTTSYYLTFGYMNQDGLIEKNNYRRYDARLNLSTQLASQLKLSTWLSGTSSIINEPSRPGAGGRDMEEAIVANSIRYPAIYAGRLSNGDYGTGAEGKGTPVAWIDSESFFQDPTFRLSSKIRLDYQVIKDLLLSGIGGYNFTDETQKIFSSTMRLNDTRTLTPSNISQEDKKTIYGTLQFLADYNKTIGNHDFSVLAGYSYETNSYRNLKATRDQLPVNNLPYVDVGSQAHQTGSGGGEDWTIQSVFGRLKYSYAQKYLFESTIRYDGSSRFPQSLKYATFPSAALGWRVSEEGFFKENVSLVNNLKVKASMGTLGNQNIGTYPYQTVYSLDAGYVMGGTFKQGAKIPQYTDPKLHWESTRTTDGGIELGLFKQGLLDINASYFYRKTTDILYKPSASVSTTLGTDIGVVNTGSLENKGWEFEVSHRNKIGNVSYNIAGNLSIIQNKVLSLGLGDVTLPNGLVGSVSDNTNALIIGYPMQAYYGYKTDGMFIDQADINTWNNQSAVASAKTTPGDLRYIDVSGKDGKPDGKVDPNYDRVYLGSRIPKYTFALNLGAGYRGFDVSAQIYGVADVKGMLSTYAGYALFADGNIQRWQMDGRWNPENPQRYNDYPRMELIPNTGSANTLVSDFWVVDASYVRLKNAQLGYTLPKSVLNKIKLQSVRVYANVENPYCWNKYRKGWDPEINTGGPNYYPILSTYTFGLNVRF